MVGGFFSSSESQLFIFGAMERDRLGRTNFSKYSGQFAFRTSIIWWVAIRLLGNAKYLLSRSGSISCNEASVKNVFQLIVSIALYSL
jgi:hypothetical protein